MKIHTCPACASGNSAKATGEFAFALFSQDAAPFFINRVCLDCGTAWQPPCPRWKATLLIFVGLLVPVVLALCVAGEGLKMSDKISVYFFGLIIGLETLRPGVGLFRQGNQGTILGKLKNGKAAPLAITNSPLKAWMPFAWLAGCAVFGVLASEYILKVGDATERMYRIMMMFVLCIAPLIICGMSLARLTGDVIGNFNLRNTIRLSLGAMLALVACSPLALFCYYLIFHLD